MDFVQTLVLGIVEGITEFLPISSTGHLILASKLLNIPDSNFLKSFEIAIQLGAILAVVVLYWRRVVGDKEIWKRVSVAFLPTAFFGFIFYKLMKEVLLSDVRLVLWSLLIGGIALILFEIWHGKWQRVRLQQDLAFGGQRGKSLSDISYSKVFAIGAVQSVAMVPGVSRAAATIVGGLLMGISRKTIVEFSFLLAVPTMAAATIFDLWKSANSFSLEQFHLLAFGFIVSFFAAIIAIKWLLRFIQNHTFISFGVYRIIIALLFWIFVL